MTKIKHHKSGRRKGRGGARKGAGRPRKAKSRAKMSNFSTRITQRTRDLLDAEARRHGDSVAQLAQDLLEKGLEERADRRDRKNRPLRALFYLMKLLAEKYVPGLGYSTDPEYNWRTNPFMFKAFTEAVVHLLASFQPSGETVAPPPNPLPPWSPKEKANFGDDLEFEAGRERAEIIHQIHFPVFDTPEKRGREAVLTLLSHLKYSGVIDRQVGEGNFATIHDVLDTEITEAIFGREVAGAIVQSHYNLSDAIRDLGLKYPPSPQETVKLQHRVQQQRRQSVNSLFELKRYQDRLEDS